MGVAVSATSIVGFDVEKKEREMPDMKETEVNEAKQGISIKNTTQLSPNFS